MRFSDIATATRITTISLREEDNQLQYCAYALQFRKWAAGKVTDALAAQSHTAINQALVMLIHKKYEWLNHLHPRHHKGKHLCIRDVMDESYHLLAAAQLTMNPPQLALPAPPKPVRRRKVLPAPEPVRYTLALGEEDNDNTTE